ncbi:Cupin, RmlC-type [Niveomyces insectorum RCEF 264]|uniref:Cupin, RmlC-type n=1 Tax=Niveomyces insectorum RCEF 264 TaxID=1081102 RepID=A0A167XAX2_9HYPO|nr:Cupin, RmlC-type [Niveomyces insectorum RCEF 264]
MSSSTADSITAILPSGQSHPRVVVTTHTKDGTSVFGADKEVPLFRPFGPSASSFAVFDVRDAVPANNQEPTFSFDNALPRCPPKGVIFCITNIPAGGVAPMHRTQSLDYAVVVAGEIVLKVDSGEEKTVKAGEYIVQGGANHSWINRTGEACRIVCFMVGAEKIKLEDGTELDSTAFKK